MPQDLEKRISDLEKQVANLNDFSTIPLEAMNAFIRRLGYSVIKTTVTLDFGNILADSTAGKSVKVQGAADGDAVLIGAPQAVATFNKLVINGYVISQNTVSVQINNTDSGNAYNPVSGTFTIIIIK